MRPFAYASPDTLDVARSLQTGSDDARFLAGGTDLLTLMKADLLEPALLIDIKRLAELDDAITLKDGRLRIGALASLTDLETHPLIAQHAPAVAEAAALAATPQLRNMATVAGNLLQRPRCWYFRSADLQCLKKGGSSCLAVAGENKYHAIFGGGPSFIVHPSTLACALLALDASVGIMGDAARTIPISELFVGPKVDPKREHSLAVGEVLVQVMLPPAPAGRRSTYAAVKEKQSHDWPLAEVAVSLSLEAGVIKDVRVVFGHVAPVPWRSPEAEAALTGKAPDAALFASAAAAALAQAKPLKHNAYKIPLAQGLLREALHRATDVPLPE